MKKGYNWKARQVANTTVDNTNTKKIQLDLLVKGSYDESNELVLPSTKRKTKIKDNRPQITKILSKKHRKRLEKVVEKKKKKENRASLLESLSNVQASADELSQLTSITSLQTKGLKRCFIEQLGSTKSRPVSKYDESVSAVKVNSIAGSKRPQPINNERIKENDLNTVGFEVSSDSEIEDEPPVKTEKLRNELQGADTIHETTEKSGVLVFDKNQSLTESNVTQSKKKAKATSDVTKDGPEMNPTLRKSAVYVDVIRDAEIQKARLALPILAQEQEIMEKINENPIVIIAGETGSGKTTQVPQFLYEAGYALKKQIAVTEPRRVAAMSMSSRVGEEMSLPDQVSYLIRFESNVTDETKIKFMTDGVLLKEVQTDFLLSKYSVVILDEAHERSVNTDILIGLLSRIVPLRNKRGDPLKLIIMSATLRLQDFTDNVRLFKKPPPVIFVERRQYPVAIHFSQRTSDDYLRESFNKTVKIHKNLPEGGVLIFLTGQQEVNWLVRKLRKAFPYRPNQKYVQNDSRIDLDDYTVPGDDEEVASSDDEPSESDDVVISNSKPLWVLPLYSLLPSHEQKQVFRPPPIGCRFCVVSTNIAETSLTIPNVKYVVDCGKTKTKFYDRHTGVSSYAVTWTSKASASQRTGRAGRLSAGHCYRLYSSAVFNDTFEEFSVPEIQQKPVDDLYLQMKCMNIHKIVNFPFPTAPDLLQLRSAEKRLEVLGALNDKKVTELGRVISKFPILPRFGKMLALSHQFDLLPYTICLVAALSVQEVLLEIPIGQIGEDEAKAMRQKWSCVRQQWASEGNSLLLGDPMVLLKAVGAAEFANSQGKLEKFCLENGLRHKAIIEIRKLRVQLTNEVNANVPDTNAIVDPQMAPPSDVQAKLLRQIVLSGMGDQIAKKVTEDEIQEGDRSKFKYAYRANEMEEPVYLHQNSVLRKKLPEFVTYQEIYETNKMYMRGVTAIEPEWLPTYVPVLCNLSAPLSEPEPRYEPTNGKVYCSVNGTYGSQAWTLPTVEIEFPKCMKAYKYFAKFFLEGLVCKKLENYVGSLLSQPSTMIKVWAKLQPRTEAILNELIKRDVRCKEALIDVWKTEPKYLLQGYLQWVPQSAYGVVSFNWPPLD